MDCHSNRGGDTVICPFCLHPSAHTPRCQYALIQTADLVAKAEREAKRTEHEQNLLLTSFSIAGQLQGELEKKAENDRNRIQ